MGFFLGLLTLSAIVFGAALVLWGTLYSGLYAAWLFAILLAPPLIAGHALGALSRIVARSLPGFPAALQSYLAGLGTPFGAAALATALAGRLMGPHDRPLPSWPTTLLLYAATTVAITAIWVLVQPADAARFYFGLDGTTPFPRDALPQPGRALGLWLIFAAAFLPAFLAALALTKRALPELASGLPRDMALAAIELVAGILVAVVATEAITVAIENMLTGREAYELGAFESLGTFWTTGFLLRAYLGYPSSGIFLYTAFAVPLWIALVAATVAILRGLDQRGVVLRGLARYQGRPVAAVGAFAFRLVLLANIGLVMLRWMGTDLDTGIRDAALPGTAATPVTMAQQFDLLMFGPDRNGRIGKLTTSSTISVEGPPELVRRHERTLDRVLTELGQLTALSFDRVDGPASLRVGFYPVRTLNRVSHNLDYGLAAGPMIRTACSASSDGEVALAQENPRELNENCLPHEFMHAIGFPGHACRYRPSALCNLDLIDGFSAGDRVLIRILYDPRLINGMTRDEAMPLVRTILQELTANAEDGAG